MVGAESVKATGNQVQSGIYHFGSKGIFGNLLLDQPVELIAPLLKTL
jgi:hypothetical protein